jgi:hypothetical protein
MRGALWTFVLAAAMLPSVGAADVQVKLREGRMAIEATNASVADVLDHISKHTGMKVIYDGAPPTQNIKVSLTERSPADAVLGVLEGRGLSFAVIMNPAGTQIQTLLVSTVKPRIPPRTVVPEEGPPNLAMPDGAEPPVGVTGMENAPPPPPPTIPPMPEGTTAPATPVPVTMATPVPPPVSPFTPQGPGPVLLPNIPGVTPIPH